MAGIDETPTKPLCPVTRRGEGEKERPHLSVIIVNYNAGALLQGCVRAVLDSLIDVEVLISDNASTDGSLARLREGFGDDPRVLILENRVNLGFAAGNNLVLDQAQAPYLLFLNPDCIVNPRTLTRMLAFMDTMPGAGIAGCLVRNPDGSEQVASRRTIPDPWLGLVRLFHLEWVWPGLALGRRLNLIDDPVPSAPVRVEAISGSFMLVRRAALDQVGPLDDEYFLHCEDLDWFVRFSRAGWGIYLVPDVDVLHYKGACSARHPLRVEWHKHRGMVRFFRKHQFRAYPLPFSLLVILGIWVHFGLVVLRQGLRTLRDRMLPG